MQTYVDIATRWFYCNMDILLFRLLKNTASTKWQSIANLSNCPILNQQIGGLSKCLCCLGFDFEYFLGLLDQLIFKLV